MSKFGRFIAVAAAGLLAAFAVTGPAAAANAGSAVPAASGTCAFDKATSVEIQVCTGVGDVKVYVGLASSCQVGHFEIWKHSDTGDLYNTQEGTYCATDGLGSFYTLPWTGETCDEFWVKDGSKFVRWGGIPCATA
jgi:hypothetical protein